MNYNWAPIVGSGFDQVAQQNLGWAQRNDAVDRANIERRNAAEQYFQQNQLHDEAIQRQEEDDAYRRAAAAQNRQDVLKATAQEQARRAYEFGENKTLTERQLDIQKAIGEGRIKEATDIAAANAAARTADASAKARDAAATLDQWQIDELNAETLRRITRPLNPQKSFTNDDLDSIKSIVAAKSKGRPLREDVYFDPAAKRWRVHSNVGSVGSSDIHYNFAPPTETGTMPQPAAAVEPVSTPVIPPWGNQGGGYVPQTPRKVLTPEIARDYARRFGSRSEAERAARADGFTW